MCIITATKGVSIRGFDYDVYELTGHIDTSAALYKALLLY